MYQDAYKNSEYDTVNIKSIWTKYHDSYWCKAMEKIEQKVS